MLNGAALDTAALVSLVQQRDPLGFLSTYVDARPGADGATSRIAAIDIGNRVADLIRRLEDGRVPGVDRMAAKAVRRLEPELERLVDPREPGRGRVLYVPLSGGEHARFAAPLPLPNRVVLDTSPSVHPLLEMIDEGRPAGVALVAGGEAQVFDWRLGELRELTRIAPEGQEIRRERSGPVGWSPSPSRSTPLREQRQAREATAQARLLERTAAAVRDLSSELEWERLLVGGPETVTEAFRRAVPPDLRGRLIAGPRALSGLPRPRLEDAVTQRLLADSRDREVRLALVLREAAQSGGAAVGLSDVLGALNEGRVAHLAYDLTRRYTGVTDGRGGLYVDGEAPPGGGPLELEPRLTERIVERCLASGARVTSMGGLAAGMLADAGGIAARLRW